LLNLGAILAVLLLGLLLFLLLFERGASYRTSQSVHQLDDADRLRILTTVLATPVQSINSLQVLREGSGLYEPQLADIRAAKHSVHLEAYILSGTLRRRHSRRTANVHGLGYACA
jgi:hypothetical protein